MAAASIMCRGLACQRAVEGNNVRLCQQLRQQYIRQPIVRRRKFVVCQNAHTEALTDFSKCAPNFASSHNTGCFAVQIEAGEAGKAEIEIAGADIGLVGVPVDREKQCHCVLGHRVRRIRGNAEHPDFSEAGPDICIVEARAAQGDDPDPKRVPPTDDGFIQSSFVKYELSFCYSRTVWYKACPSTTLRVLIYNDHPFWRYSFPVQNTESFSLHSQIPLYQQYA